VAGLLLAGLLAAIWVPASAAPPTELAFLDQFDTRAYDNSDGSGSWSSPWIEIGESDGVDEGAVRVRGHSHCPDDFCLYLGNHRDAAGRGVQRSVDLEGAENAQLEFLYQRHMHDDGKGRVEVLISGDGGVSWTEVREFLLDKSDTNAKNAMIPLGPYISSDTRVRFLLDGGDEGDIPSHIQIDDVTITARWVDSPTTTTVAPTTTTVAPTTTTVAPTTTTVAPTTTVIRPPGPEGETPPATTMPPATTAPPATTTTTTTTTQPPVPVPSGRPTEGLVLSAAAPVLVADDALLGGPADLTPLSRMMATFSTTAESLSSPAVAYLILGAAVAWLSVKGLERAPRSRRVRWPGLRRR
jgi:hypothetical protein